MDSTEVFRKLKFDNKRKSLIMNAPTDYQAILSDSSYDKEYLSINRHSYDFIQVFAETQAELEKLLHPLKDAGKYDCLFWICYPKGDGKIKSDLKRNLIWSYFSIVGLRPVTQIAIDETWSALRGRPEELIGK